MNDQELRDLGAEYAIELGYKRRIPGDATSGIECVDCGQTFPRADGSVMRGHRRRCPVRQADPYTPAVCDS